MEMFFKQFSKIPFKYSYILLVPPFSMLLFIIFKISSRICSFAFSLSTLIIILFVMFIFSSFSLSNSTFNISFSTIFAIESTITLLFLGIIAV